MSAATRGFEIPFTVLATNSNEVRCVIVGARLLQKSRICDSSQERFSEWYIKSIKGDIITVAPLRALDVGCGRPNAVLKMSRSKLLERFKVRPRRIC